MRYSIISVATIALMVTIISGHPGHNITMVRPAKRIQIQLLDHPLVLAQIRRATFFAAVSPSDETCGWLRNFHNPVCFYCMGDAMCDSILRDDIIYFHHKQAADAGCTNKMRVLTRKVEEGECAPWIQRITMIMPQENVNVDNNNNKK